MKLIDKDAALAVIDKRINQIATGITEIPLTGREKADATLEREVLGKVRSLIDSLEVKEVDLEKEYKDFVEEDPVYNKLVNGIVGKSIAKHFFELGLHHSITKDCVNEICQLFMEREAIEKFFPDSIDWVYKQLQKGK